MYTHICFPPMSMQGTLSVLLKVVVMGPNQYTHFRMESKLGTLLYCYAYMYVVLHIIVY